MQEQMLLEVRVQPKASRNSVEVVGGVKIRVYVTAAPVAGKANEAVAALLAKRLGVARGSIRIVKGHAVRDKLLCIEGFTAEEVLVRLSSQK